MPSAESSALIVVDVQERFAPAIPEMAQSLPRMALALAGAKELGLQLVATEQYPKGLGRTLPEIAALLPQGHIPLEKTSFSCFGAEAFRTELSKSALKTLALIGVESHVCVLQTALDALERGYEVFVLSDCVSSRKGSDKEAALAFLGHAGVKVLSAESFLFMLLKDASHPAFKAVSKLVR